MGDVERFLSGKSVFLAGVLLKSREIIQLRNRNGLFFHCDGFNDAVISAHLLQNGLRFFLNIKRLFNIELSFVGTAGSRKYALYAPERFGFKGADRKFPVHYHRERGRLDPSYRYDVPALAAVAVSERRVNGKIDAYGPVRDCSCPCRQLEPAHLASVFHSIKGSPDIRGDIRMEPQPFYGLLSGQPRALHHIRKDELPLTVRVGRVDYQVRAFKDLYYRLHLIGAVFS